MTVITRSNEDEPYEIGIFCGWNAGCYHMPSVDYGDGVPVNIGGIIVPYSEELAFTLNRMTPQDQWNFLYDLVMLPPFIHDTQKKLQKQHKKRVKEEFDRIQDEIRKESSLLNRIKRFFAKSKT